MSDRTWTYSRETWCPPHRWLPYFGGDEYGRRTIVLPIPFGGYLVWAFWTCSCAFCDEVRAQTEEAEGA